MGTTRLEVTSDRDKDGADQPCAKPFSIRPGVGETVAHRSWTQARKAVLAALLNIPCVVVIVGAPGTGKTLLLADLARALEDAGAAPVLYTRGDFAQGLDELPAPEAAHRRIVLVDEADRMTDAALTDLATQPGLGLVVAYTYDPTEDARFRGAVGERRLSVVRLEPLAKGEVPAFLAASLARAGRPANTIDADALARIELRSGGVPRLVNMLAGAALFISASEGAAEVSAQHVEDAAEMSGLTEAAEADGVQTDDEAMPSWETKPATDVPDIAPADLAAIAQSWADAAIGPPAAPKRDAAPEASEALAAPPLRASGDSRLGVPVAARAGGARRRAAAAVLLLLGAGAGGGWFALRGAGPTVVAPSGASARDSEPTAAPQVAVATPVTTPGVAGPATASLAPAPPAIADAAGHGKTASAPSDPPGQATGPETAQADPSPAHATSPVAPLPTLRTASPPAVARARPPARTPPRPTHAMEADAGRGARPARARPELPPEADPRAGGLLGVLREFSARDEARPEREPSGGAGLYGSAGPPRRPQAEPSPGGYVGSYVMGPDGRRMFVQDP